MANRRSEMHRLQEMVRLRRMGVGCHETARQLKMSPNTERRYRQALEKAGLLWGPVETLPELSALKAAVNEHMPKRLGAQEVSTVEPWREAIEEMVSRGAQPRAIFDRLRLEEAGFSGSLGAVKRMVKRVKRSEGFKAEQVALWVETEPGEIGQVDFGYVGRLYDPASALERKAWLFVMVLGYSRHMYAKVVFDQSASTWQKLHVSAFNALGGAPRTLVPDNLKAAVIERAFGTGADTELNRSYVELARHYGCLIDPTPVRAPEKKGKVESAVNYVKSNFFKPRSFVDVDEANRRLRRWVSEIAGRRVHGSTGRVPLEVFEAQEAQALLPLPPVGFEAQWWTRATVHRDSHINVRGRVYSVPWQYVGQKLWVKVSEKWLQAYADDLLLCTHNRNQPGRRVTVDSHLPEHRVKLRHRSPDYWQRQADALGEHTGALVREMFAAGKVLSPLRQVQALVSHLKTFPVSRAEAACKRARHFGNHTYVGVKQILKQGLDLEALPGEEEEGWGGLERPRFARTGASYLVAMKGVDDVQH